MKLDNFCPHCIITFDTKGDLNKHLLQHNRMKLKKFKQFGYSSIKAGHLKQHMLIHSGEKYF